MAVDPREDTLEQLQECVDQKTKERIMSAAEKLIQQGRQQGIEKTAKQMLAKGLDTGFISELTGLSEEQLQQLTP